MNKIQSKDHRIKTHKTCLAVMIKYTPQVIHVMD